MSTDRRDLVLPSALLTAATMAGPAIVFFWLLDVIEVEDVMGGLPLFITISLGLPLLIGPMFLGGALWGWGTAAMAGAPRRPAARTGALAVAGMVLLLELPVHMSQALPMPGWPLGIHGVFTVVLMIEVALVAGVATTRLLRRMDVDPKPRKAGRRVGLAAAAGFLVGSVAALAVGWEVGRPPSDMVPALHLGNILAGLLSGGVLGWSLADRIDLQDRAPAVEDLTTI